MGRAWFDHWKGPRSPRHADYVLRRLEADVFPAIGRKQISELTAPVLLAMAKKIEERGAIDTRPALLLYFPFPTRHLPLAHPSVVPTGRRSRHLP